MNILPVLTTRRDAQRTYGRLSRFYDVTEGLAEGPAKSLALQVAGATPGETVLEVGPGTGWALRRLATAVGQAGVVCGVDIAPGMLAETRKRLRGRRAALALGDVAALPLASERFDLVFMTFVLELIPTEEIPVVLGDVMRVLRPGGRFVDVSLSRESPNLATRIYEWGHKVLPGLLDCRPIYVRRAVATSGFEIVRTRRITILGLPAEIVLARKPGLAVAVGQSRRQS